MPNKDFIPTRDAEFLPWSANFSEQLQAMGASVGILPAQQTAYAALHAAFATAYATAVEPSTRTRGTISAKNDARRPLQAMARELARKASSLNPATLPTSLAA